MKRYTTIKNFINLLHENDVLIFSGSEVCKEAYLYDKSNYFYINKSFSVAASFGLGMAMCTDKRIFVFIGEGELLRELGVLAQIGISKCTNMFLVVLDNGCYQMAGGHPTIFEGVLSKRGLVYNSGCKMIALTKHFKDRRFKQLKDRFSKLTGPLVFLMDVDRGVKKDLKEIDLDFVKRCTELKEFVQNQNLESALFSPSVLFPDVGETNTLNLNQLNNGGIS